LILPETSTRWFDITPTRALQRSSTARPVHRSPAMSDGSVRQVRRTIGATRQELADGPDDPGACDTFDVPIEGPLR
jgi:hypothetical protein